MKSITDITNITNITNLFNKNDTSSNEDTFLQNFEEVTIINSAGNYLITKTGETLRLSGIQTLTKAGDEFVYNSLLNRTVWIYRDGVDKENYSCVYLFTNKPSGTFRLDNSLNRLVIAKCFGTSGSISNGPLSDKLKNYLIYPIP